tara:strand:+ start:495 stop:1082 length:588 start_codon:yes stop_codon:yes gene_type:complete
MIYGDLQFFDIVIFACIAAFLIFRLRSVLGKRSGFEKNFNQKSENINLENKEAKKNTIPELNEKFSKFKTAYENLENFDHKVFLDGAKIAFETIINSFNKGDKNTLKNLLTPPVYKSFESAIDEKNIDPDYQFYSLTIEKVDDVVVENSIIKITVSFLSEQFKNNDENTVIKKQDTWTFEKPTKSKNPNWLLSST